METESNNKCITDNDRMLFFSKLLCYQGLLSLMSSNIKA